MNKRTLLASFIAAPFVSRAHAENRRFVQSSSIRSVVSDPAFAGYGRLLFPLDRRFWSGDSLGEIGLAWYTELRPKNTVAVFNFLKEEAQGGVPVYTLLYSREEIEKDAEKADTGLIFFKGREGAPFAVVCAGGGFRYVGALHDSFPQALALARKGINAFAIIYRPDAQKACEDLARALSVIFQKARAFGVSTNGYSLWGGSAGARMAAWVGRYGTQAFGEKTFPKPVAVVMAYTGLADASPDDPPTFACVGTEDWIADWRVMKRRIDRLTALGIPTEFHAFPGLSHGFGIGTGTLAEGWVDRAVDFWMKAAAARKLPRA